MTTKLNARGDGMHAYSDPAEVQQWEVTQWLIECVEDNNDINDAAWSDWSGPEGIISTYQPAISVETGKLTAYDPDGREESMRRITIGDRGREVLAACIRGQDPGDLMSQWSLEIEEAGAAPSP